MEDSDPIHFGDEETYLDYIISTLIYLVHGPVDEDAQLLIYYEYKVRIGEDIISHYNYTI